ncbi:MAG: 4-(cytidine 5'-diphospho)-2-C-methyl-D-erythritol kinase [Ruminococcus sp.]|nr:4-(cytidine 5'-diphospho)-2-C-methyl-D-erythritol kinase [Ruminococcus sp.]
MDKIKALAFAKINLSLDITGRRDDGYHLLSTVMQSVSLCDSLYFEKSNQNGIFITCDDDSIPTGEKNIVCKAAAKLFERYGERGVKIHIEKKIPHGAGLAGGSADAAATLLALNELFELNASKDELLKIGVSVGADVAFCMCGGTILCEGIGEKLTPLEPLDNFYALIVKSDVLSPTDAAYKRCDEANISSSFNQDELSGAIAQGDISTLSKNLYNVFELVTPKEVINEAKAALIESGALGAIMTGSGSAVFGLFDNQSDAKKAYSELSGRFPFVHLAKPVQNGVEFK